MEFLQGSWIAQSSCPKIDPQRHHLLRTINKQHFNSYKVLHYITHIYLESIITDVTAIMSLFGYGARPQPSSAEKIAAAEQEMDLVTDMFNKYVLVLYSSS